MKKWYRLDVDEYSFFYRRCFYYDVEVKREDGRLLIMLPRIQTWTAGPYRCVADNSTEEMKNSSQSYTIPVHCKYSSGIWRWPHKLQLETYCVSRLGSAEFGDLVTLKRSCPHLSVFSPQRSSYNVFMCQLIFFPTLFNH